MRPSEIRSPSLFSCLPAYIVWQKYFMEYINIHMTQSKLIKRTAGPIAYWSGKMGGEHGIRDKGRTVTLWMLLFCEPGFKT